MLDEKAVEAVLARMFGHEHAAFWPTPLRERPGLFAKSIDKLTDAAIRRVVEVAGGTFDQRFRDAYWREVRHGQAANEDAGGYLWRCWAAAFGFTVERGPTPREVLANNIIACTQRPPEAPKEQD